MSYKGGADKDLFSHISATFSVYAFLGKCDVEDATILFEVLWQFFTGYAIGLRLDV